MVKKYAHQSFASLGCDFLFDSPGHYLPGYRRNRKGTSDGNVGNGSQAYGIIALTLTIIVFILNPLLASYPKFPLAAKMNHYRRNIGVAAFGYASIHFLAVVKFKTYEFGQFPWIALLIHPVLVAGFIALIIYFLLSITSNNYSVRKLGGKRWKKLHRKGYIAEWCIFLH